MTTATIHAPTTEAELSEIILAASGPISVRGGATRHVPHSGTPLTTRNLTGVQLYEPGALTLVARAGTPVDEIDALLAKRNQRLPFEPMDHRPLLGTTGQPTIGGVIGLNHCGPRRLQAGAARDLLLGVRMVDGTGRIIKNGGRVMKNVTGYDLARLNCGARATLGIVTEISLKVLPLPEAVATLALDVTDPERAVRDMAVALGSPYDITGAAWDGDRALLRIEGFEDSVRYRAERLMKLLPGTVKIADNPWPEIRDCSRFAGLDTDVWRVSLRASQGGLAARVLREKGIAVQLDWGGALLWASAPAGTDLRALMGNGYGHATLLRGKAGPGIPQLEPQAAAVAALSARLRDGFDPRGLFCRS